MSNVAAQGTSITIQVGAGAATNIAGFTDFSGLGGGSPTVIDTSDLSSNFKTKQIGMLDEGQAKLSFNMIDADPGQAALRTARVSKALAAIVITLANGDKLTFSGYVMTVEPGLGIDKIVTLSSTVEISGAVTYTPHS